MTPQTQPTVPQTPQAQPPQNQPTQPNALDPQAVNLTKAIRQTESGGNFQAKGASGEYGAYQFEPSTWDAYAKEAGINTPLSQATPEQQNEVAYKKIKQWKDQGYNVGQIASMWNAGEGSPDAYLKGHIGVNDKGVSYNTPAYAQKVATNYQKLKAGSDIQADPPNSGGGSILNKIINFAFPIVGDIGADIQGKSDKTALQQLGDAGLSALWFVPGLGEAGEAALTGARLGGVLGETGLKVGGQILGGAATGYGADVASKLAQGQTGAGVLTPGVGTLTGAGVGAFFSRANPLINMLFKNTTEEGAVQATADALNGTLKSNKSGQKIFQTIKGSGHDTGSLLARSGAVPEVNEMGRIDTAAAQEKMNENLAQLGSLRAMALDATGAKFSWSDFTKQALANAKKYETGTGAVKQTQAQIRSTMAALKKEFGSDASMSTLEKIKEKQTKDSKVFNAFGKTKEANAASYIGGAAKDHIEAKATASGLPGMNEYNDLMAAHFDALKHLQTIEGQTAGTGLLRQALTKHAAGVVGGIAGTAAGGPFGGILAAAGSEIGAGLIQKLLGKTNLSNPLRELILSKIEQENPEIVQQFIDYAKKTPKGLEALKEQLEEKGIKTFGAKVPETVAPQLSPRSSAIPGLIKRGATTAAVKAVAQ